MQIQHLNGVKPDTSLRPIITPPQPAPFPINDPPDPPENPDVPVREPDPQEPGQI
jgi:hypothetical protein